MRGLKGLLLRGAVFSHLRKHLQVAKRPLSFLSNSLKFPQKLEGTVVERWADYWVAVLKDYRTVFVDLGKDLVNKPVKGAACAAAAGCFAYLAHLNPDETDFRDAYLTAVNDFAFVGPPIRNKETVRHFKQIERFYNEGVVRRISLGIVSLIYVDPHRTEFAAPKANCKYLSPRLADFHQRVVDVGFFGRWWILRNKIIDWDVNPDEWPHEVD